MNELPNHPLTNIDLVNYAKQWKIKHFRGVFMRDELPKKIRCYEKGIINLDSIDGSGTHWVAYTKNARKITYFDSFGNLRPPIEVLYYFHSNGPCTVHYNYNIFQRYNSFNCGHLCLKFLLE